MGEVLAILVVGLVGGAVPLCVRWNDRHLHTALALATGIFLGAVFLHFLPSLSGMSLGEGHGHDHGGDMWLWLFVLLGVLGVYLVEALILRAHDHDERHRHKAIGYAALVGLTVHSLLTGVGFAAAEEQAVARPLLLAILAHKGFEAFSLTTVFQLAEARRTRLLLLVGLFSLATPAGILVGDALTTQVGPAGVAIVTALAAGTFLYVCLCELLVEVFHHREDSLLRLALLAIGIALMVVLEWEAL